VLNKFSVQCSVFIGLTDECTEVRGPMLPVSLIIECIITCNPIKSACVCVCVQYIENLERLRHLEVLNLSKNDIERIEKLDKLICLRELNLSFNCIAKIERLEYLTSLQVLNLSGNKIETIPPWLAKKLKALRLFKIARNHIQSVSTAVCCFLFAD